MTASDFSKPWEKPSNTDWADSFCPLFSWFLFVVFFLVLSSSNLHTHSYALKLIFSSSFNPVPSPNVLELISVFRFVFSVNDICVTQTSVGPYPSVAVRQMSSPSWHSSTVVKPVSSTVSSGDTRGDAGGGEQLPQHSPSAEPSVRLLASRAKPGWGGFLNPQGTQKFSRGSGGGGVP